MRDRSLFHRDWLAIGAVVAALALLAAFAVTRLGGDGGESPPPAPGTSMSDLLPVTEDQFQQALAVAVEHGRAMGTFDPGETEDAYFARLEETADSQYAGLLSGGGSAAAATVGLLAEWGRPATGTAEPTGAPMIAPALVTVELSLRAEEAGGGDSLDLGVVHVSLREDGDTWVVIGVTDAARLDALQGEGVI
ncbi:hypothetical protein [Actinorugispora endophytica]|uniref:Mce-associated membrane protein n=1 Tax=Actinorugispora endophytica TaxID=1605990 RepID=A0A4R6V721_9ACTN|nr:hypothetical protein [Actinorugispora endophytica]TDQ55012.1 hypothetical protein EV190_101333 [Actinorugispora endophytica]